MRKVYDDYLEHYNIKGAKWGIRRWQNPDGSLTPAGKVRYSKARGKKRASAKKAPPKKEPKAPKPEKPNYSPKKKNVSEMTDDEIREAIARFELERKYKDFVSPPKKIKEGKTRTNILMKTMGDIAIASVKTAGTAYATAGMNQLLGELLPDLKPIVNKEKQKKKKSEDE